MRAFAALTLLACAVAGPAPAQQREIAVAVGEGVEVAEDDGGVFSALTRTAGEAASEYEVQLDRNMNAGVYGPSSGKDTAPVPIAPAGQAPPPIAPGRVHFRFVSTPDHHTVLFIANGYDRGFVYRAVMVRDGQRQPTDVCLVRPNRFTVESWPYPIESIVVTEPHLTDWHDGDPVPCV